MVASGVRRSCDSAARTAVRTRSACRSRSPCSASAGQPVPLDGEHRLRGEHLDQARSAGVSGRP